MPPDGATEHNTRKFGPVLVVAGDSLLRELGSLFRRNIRNTDVIGRYGGDEFVWLLPETDLEMTSSAARKP